MSETSLVGPEIPGATDGQIATEADAAKRRRAGSFVTLGELEKICKAQPTNYIVDGLLPADDVHVAVGDSGLGKTPWAYQLGLCVATGRTFLGHAVKQGRVLYYDLENGRQEILEVGRSLCGYLSISSFPPEFLVLRDEGNPVQLRDAVEAHCPLLVIVDTLRAFRPRAEASNEEMASFLNECKRVARQFHCAILLLHHIKKPGENGVSSLEITSILEWLLQASGARALVNQTNTRIAFDVPGFLSHAADAALVMKSFVKMRGESGPFYLARVLDAGEPIG
jgi:AAA domain-containing protein